MKNIYLIAILLFASHCLAQKSDKSTNSLSGLSKEELWHLNSFELDSVPGIDLSRALNFLKDKKSRPIVIAVIDSDVDIDHSWIKDILWSNPDETSDNGLDDDGNGYIDDIHGWNYLRNKKGTRINYASSSAIRYITQFKKQFKDTTLLRKSKDSISLDIYKQAWNSHKNSLENAKKELEFLYFIRDNYPISKKVVDSIFYGKNYTLEDLDSLKFLYKGDDKLFKRIKFMHSFKRLKMEDDFAEKYKEEAHFKVSRTNNLDYYDRSSLKDNSMSINHIHYGSGIVNSFLNILWHGTAVSGVLNYFDNTKIMILSITPKTGSHTDEDLAKAIRYAVDNGAKVINMSSSNDFSPNNEIVLQALKYAENKGVIFVRSAGNSGQNIDEYTTFPNNDNNLTNFLIVGASGKSIEKSLKPSWANYGKNKIDLFAPGEDILTAEVLKETKLISGSSMSAPLVAGTIALIKSHYPNLTISQIKEILHKSVDKYNVDITLENGEKVPFSDLSISGGILNAYKAVKLADIISNKQK
ncbi:S8 family serine peptidase [Aureibaculum conchae]|uniref:S8 family serine peptidase n=1 Tax=Aureibaculum sp. 2308TA14-22 TaxID=3108392 RepID=UPI0033918A4F